MDMQKTQKLEGPARYQRCVPSVCANCGKVYSINKLYAEDGKQVNITHGLCDKCFEEIQEKSTEDDPEA